jgi:sirohydrochlorin ferrochelatase
MFLFESHSSMPYIRNLLAVLVLTLGFRGAVAADTRGILLLAHGGGPEWNAQVQTLAEDVNRTTPTEVAFGMATRGNIQSAVERLQARGVTEIVSVPLFVSSWSSVIRSTEYLLALRADAPPELDVYARMSHSHGPQTESSNGHDSHHHPSDGEAVGKTPVTATVPIRMTCALNGDPVVADILLTRVRSISQTPQNEAVIVVAHGPVSDEDNERWLRDMSAIAHQIGLAGRFAPIDYLTLRDDAPAPVRDAATAELRALVERRLAEHRRVLIAPLLISYGGIERRLRERLEGLAYTMPGAALMPDQRLAQWVLATADRGPACSSR